MNQITQVLTPFDTTKQAVEGSSTFRANAGYSWSWLIEHTNQQNTLIEQINVVVSEVNANTEQVAQDAQQVSQDKQTVLEAKDIAVQAKEDAVIAKNEAQAIYDNFDDRYLGAKTSHPTLDNDGEALKRGALYYNSANDSMYVYDLELASWIDISYIPTLFSSLTDVLFSGLSNDDILKYDAALGKWKNIPRDYYSKIEMDNILLSVTSAGTVITFANSSVPTGFLECNGALLSRTTYADLFAVIGETYGVGDGSTTFAIPDLRGEFIRGWDNGKGVDSGRAIGSSQSDQFKAHSHISYINVDGTIPIAGGVNGQSYSNLGSNTTSTGGTETRPRNIAMMYCIKY